MLISKRHEAVSAVRNPPFPADQRVRTCPYHEIPASPPAFFIAGRSPFCNGAAGRPAAIRARQAPANARIGRVPHKTGRCRPSMNVLWQLPSFRAEKPENRPIFSTFIVLLKFTAET
ncbi:hypothetical protein [Martelella sp. AD-3]|uniref:hypothetical protein n=1 Tax=Martelella sp. AD-3 TaxID=686597 RepID=UPI001268F679|nr:hypothetical protein [Martelella sp. AD-3]